MRQHDAGTWGFGDLTRVTGLQYVADGIGLVCNLVLTPILFRTLGRDDYGLWVVVLSLVGILYFLELGLSDNILRAVSRSRASGQLAEAEPVVANGVLLAIATASVTVVLILLGQGLLSRWIALTPDQEDMLQPLILVGLVLFSTGLFSGIADAVLMSTKRFVPSYAIDISETVAATAVTWIALLLGHGLLAVAVVAAAAQSISTVMKLVVVRRAAPDLSLSPFGARWTRTSWQPLTKPLAWTSIIFLAAFISYDVDDLILGSVLSTGAVATVTVAFRIPAVLMSFVRTAFSGVFPYSADLAGRSDTASVARLLIYGTRLALILTMLSLVAFWYVGPPLLELWVGPVENGAMLLRLGLVLNVVFNGVVVVELALYGWGEMRTLAIITVLGGLVNLPLTLVLTHTVGLAGPLLGTLAGGIVIAVLSVERAARLIDCSVLAFCRDAVLGPIAAIGPVVLALLLAQMVVGPGPLQVLGLTGIGMAIYLAGALTMSFSKADRGHGRALVQRAVRQFSLRA